MEGGPRVNVVDGKITKTIYSLIADGNYNDAIEILTRQAENYPSSRAALSLLGYSYFQNQDFIASAESYEELVKACPDVEKYKLYLAQSYFKACQYDEAIRVSQTIEEAALGDQVRKLQAAIKYEQEEISGAKTLIDCCSGDDPDTFYNDGCIAYKVENYRKAIKKFTEASNIVGYDPNIAYNIGLCHYKLKQYGLSLKHISDIIERGIRDHPDLGVGMATEGIDVRSVGNSATLHKSKLVAAFNLRAGIEYQTRNFDQAREALTDMPPRDEAELDPITLHNVALMHMESDATAGFEKLQFLLEQNPCPNETFGNLLLLYCKYGYYDMAADVLAENAEMSFKNLSKYMYSFLEATIVQQTTPADAYAKFEEMAGEIADRLKLLTKEVSRAKSNHDEEKLKRVCNEYDEALEMYVPLVMAQAKIYWDMEHYQKVEKIFRNSVDFCSELDVWKLNVAHTLFMQETKFKEAAGFYDPIVKSNYDDVLDVTAIVLANLCVSYIMTSQNEVAEDLMRCIEKEEERIAYEEPDRKLYHLCIVNLVIGTLYCSKSNYAFGISRIMKALEPYNRKLGSDTWFYAKRCLLSLAEHIAKQTMGTPLKDPVMVELLQFLDAIEVHGADISTLVDDPLQETDPVEAAKNTVAYEARVLKHVFLKLMA